MILETHDLTKIYNGKKVVDQLNISVAKGTLTAFLGPNGAGKSTTISMLIGKIEPSSGEICFASENSQKHRPRIGVVFQDSVLDQDLTVRENLVSRAKMYRIPLANSIDKLIADIGLERFQHQAYGSLSGGQRRRVDIARALLNKPEILFLDEPTTALDIQTRTAIWDLLHALQRETNLTIFLTTHYLQEAQEADQVYIIDDGRTIAQGSADDLRQHYTQSLLRIQTDDLVKLISLLPKGTQSREDDGVLVINVQDAQTCIGLLQRLKTSISEFEFSPGTIDDVFLNLTGKEIR
ncbi:ABC transporter ATP-binding protein [Oenococcus sicerae]|uniref:ABC transporter ATP-binding protein n=1 Tax=Oenococcus sicerae TaxID=2203724 RepID=A0AAJ1R9G7_9LACO|nr:ABC transporter ATP-binding protein [Oenococcus sicerae]MDN6900543.1 ABC transporter ATP-binding protein [Oenococcus sicerae]QAS69440.1 ABC transporter ATP-binding protein [Oenococcus sicerae]